jgi:hypothetical protein
VQADAQDGVEFDLLVGSDEPAIGVEFDIETDDTPPDLCAACGTELGENALGTPGVDGLFCGTACLEARVAPEASDAGARVVAALEAGALEDAIAAGQAAADAGADVREAVAGVLEALVDVVAEELDTDEPSEPRPTYDQLMELASTDAEVAVRLRRGRPSPQLIAGLVCSTEWRTYRIATVAEFGCRSYMHALAEDDTIHVRLVG